MISGISVDRRITLMVSVDSWYAVFLLAFMVIFDLVTVLELQTIKVSCIVISSKKKQKKV